MAEEEPLQVKVWSPNETYFEGRATSVSASNRTGPFDVLDGHANFFTIVLPGDVVVNSGGKEERIAVQQGIMRVNANRVTVFTNI